MQITDPSWLCWPSNLSCEYSRVLDAALNTASRIVGILGCLRQKPTNQSCDAIATTIDFSTEDYSSADCGLVRLRTPVRSAVVADFRNVYSAKKSCKNTFGLSNTRLVTTSLVLLCDRVTCSISGHITTRLLPQRSYGPGCVPSLLCAITDYSLTVSETRQDIYCQLNTVPGSALLLRFLTGEIWFHLAGWRSGTIGNESVPIQLA